MKDIKVLTPASMAWLDSSVGINEFLGVYNAR